MKRKVNIDPSYVDELTGVYNRRYLKEKQKQETEKLITKKLPFSVVMVDIDHFKQINDTYGHLKGDAVIRDFAQFLKSTLRSMDTIVRYGGDEFVCVMPHTIKHDAEMIYRRILENCKKQEFKGLKITLSVGISSYPDDGRVFDELLIVADQALYDAKRSGRDRIKTLGEKKAEIPMKTFVNRLKEKDKIQRSLIDNVGGIRVTVVRGNVGIGKTRLGKEVLAEIKGKEIIWCDCIFFSDEIPYYPIREIIKYRTQRLGIDIIEDIPLAYKIEIGKLVPEIMSKIEDEIKGLELVVDKYRLFEGVRRILDIGERDKIIILDNIQWIDKESTEVLKYLMRSMRDKSMTFILIYRAEEKTEVLEDFIAYISREVKFTDTVLTPFEHRDIKESVKLIIGEEPKKSLIEYVVHESGGNPFFIEEIMRELLNGGYLVVEEDKWRFKEPAEEIVPKTLTDIAVRKYRTLSQEAKNVLEIASSIGWFDIGTLKEITGYNEGHIVGLIDNISRLGLIKRAQNRFKFSDSISRNAIYKKYVTGAKCMELHRQIAECAEVQNKGKEHEVADELAVHYFHAQEKEKGVSYCIMAGNQAKDEYASNNAIKYYTWAIQLLDIEKDQGKIGIKIDCIVKRAELLNFIGENENALKDLEKALSLAFKLGDKKRQADIKHKKSSVYTSISQYENALQEADECVELYKETGNRNEIAGVLLTRGTIYFRQGKNNESLRANKDALEINKKIKDQVAEANIHNNIGNVYFSQGNFSKALSKYEDSLKMFREIGDKIGESKSLNNIGNIYYSSGDYTNALKRYEDTLKILREIGYRVNEHMSLRNIGLIHYNTGDYTKALQFHEEALKIVRDIQSKDDEAMLLSDIGDICNNWGDYERAQKYYDDSLRVAEEINSNRIACFTLVSMADVHMNLNQRKKAKKFLDQAYKNAEDSKERLQNVLVGFCDYYLEEKEFKKFNETISTIEDLFKEERTKNFEGDISILLGRYYSAIKNFNGGEEYFEKALKIFEELKEPLSIGKTYYYWGCMELARGKKPVSHEKLRRALKIFETTGTKGWKNQTEKIFKK